MGQRVAFIALATAVVVGVLGCGGAQHPTPTTPTTSFTSHCDNCSRQDTVSAGTKTVTYRWAKPYPLYVRIQGPAEAVDSQAHALRAHFERTHPMIVRSAPGHAICAFPGLQGSVTVRLYGDKNLVSARCKRIAKALGE